MKYIVKEGKAISTLRGIIGHPKDINDVKEKEFVTEKDIKTGKSGLDRLLKLENSPLVEYEKIKKQNKKAEPIKEDDK